MLLFSMLGFLGSDMVKVVNEIVPSVVVGPQGGNGLIYEWEEGLSNSERV